MDQLQPKKSFFRRFWWLWTILGIGILLLTATAYSGYKHDQELGGFRSVPGLAKCPQNLSGLLTSPIINPHDLSYIVPLGALSPPGHVLPVDHLYFVLSQEKENTKTTPLYAPGDMTLTSIDNVTQYYTGELATRRGSSRSDYALFASVCQGVRMYIGGLSALSDKLKSAEENGQKNCTSSKAPQSVLEGKGVTGSDTCTYNLNLKLQAGEILGATGGFEVGAFNQNQPLSYVNPDRYNANKTIDDSHTLCLLDLYPTNVRESFENLLGDLNLAKKFRTAEPRCGQIMQDMAGTLRGNWFSPDKNQAGESGGGLVGLVHQNWDPTLGAISPGAAFYTDPIDANHALTFQPTNSGTYNREFSEVKPGETLYCYDEAGLDKSIGWPEYPYKFLIQLLDNTHIKIEKQKGSCGVNEKFNKPFEYER